MKAVVNSKIVADGENRDEVVSANNTRIDQ